jgi:hypothetical protein
MEVIVGMPLPIDAMREEFALLVTGEVIEKAPLTCLATVAFGAAPWNNAERDSVLVEDGGAVFGTEIGIETGQRLQRLRP